MRANTVRLPRTERQLLARLLQVHQSTAIAIDADSCIRPGEVIIEVISQLYCLVCDLCFHLLSCCDILPRMFILKRREANHCTLALYLDIWLIHSVHPSSICNNFRKTILACVICHVPLNPKTHALLYTQRSPSLCCELWLLCSCTISPFSHVFMFVLLHC